MGTNPGAGPVSTAGMKLPYGYHTLMWYMANVFLVEGTPNLNAGLGTGLPAVAALLAASEEVGIALATGDEVYWKEPLTNLMFMDLANDIQARVLFEAAVAADTGVDFSLHVKGQAIDALNTDAKASADGSVTFAAQTTVVTGMEATEWAALNVAGKFNPSDVPDIALKFALTMDDTGTAAADEIKLIGVQLRFTMALEALGGVQEMT